MGSNTLIIMFMMAFALLRNLIFARDSFELDTLTCTSHDFCHCIRNVLLCNITNDNFILPENIALREEIVSISLQGEKFSVEIPDTYYNNSWSAIKHFEVIGSRGILSLPLSFTQSLKNLTILRVRNSNLSFIESYAFSFLRNILELDLSNNGFLHIREVEKGLQNFSSETIKVFNISGIHNAENMQAFIVTGDLLSPLTSVKVFDMSWTRASKFHASFELMPSLVSINMSGTILLGPAVCFSSLANLQNLEIFTMDHWPKLARDDGLRDHQTNSSLEVFEEIKCKLIPFFDNRTGCIVMPPKLKQIYSRFVDSESMFVSLEKGVCVLNNNVELLSFSHMKVFDPISALYGFHKLKVLDISMLGVFFKINLLVDMPDLETFLSSGNILNNIETDPKFRTVFFKNRELKHVDLSNNNLRIIPDDVFSNNPLLEIIDLSMNTLVSINLNLSANVYLRKLNLKQNRIKTISPALMIVLENMFNSVNSTVQLNIGENDLICECEHIEFVTWMLTTTIELVNGTDLVCRDMDSNIRNISEIDILYLEESCSAEAELAVYVIIILCLIPVGFVFTVIVILCLRYHSVFCFRTRIKTLKSSITGHHLNQTSCSVIELEEIKFSEPKDAFILVPKGATPAYKRSPKYAVFLAYCHEDSDFVVKKIHQNLEVNLRKYLPDKNEDTLTLLYDKNFLPGVDLYDICKAAVINSYVTIAIISENFIGSNWCSYEMQTAIEAGVPIIPLYLKKCDGNNLSGIIKLIYDKKVRLLWPQATINNELISSEEHSLILILAKTVAAYVRKYDT